jgi:hypothetical protein
MVEGFVNKVKWIKRSSYGQAGFPLREPPREARIRLLGNGSAKIRDDVLSGSLHLPPRMRQAEPGLHQWPLQQHSLCLTRMPHVLPLALMGYNEDVKEGICRTGVHPNTSPKTCRRVSMRSPSEPLPSVRPT